MNDNSAFFILKYWQHDQFQNHDQRPHADVQII